MIMFLIIQQLEGNLIYPRVVGNSVGLPSIWVLAAVSVGGSMFGVVGMLCFIPLVSTFYTLLRENVNKRNGLKDGSKADVTESDAEVTATELAERTEEAEEADEVASGSEEE